MRRRLGIPSSSWLLPYWHVSGCLWGRDRGDRFLKKVMWVRLQNIDVVAIGIFMVLLCCREAMADSVEYLGEPLLLGSDEFFAEQVAGLVVKVTNRGYLTWPLVASDPSHPVRISYHLIGAD